MSVNQFNITAEVRADVGKGASRRLRHAGKFPAVVYGSTGEPRAVTLEQTVMAQHVAKESFYTSILTINVAGTEEKAIVKDMQWHPYKPLIMHMDLLRVDDSTVIKLNVPLHFINQDDAPGVKAGGVASHILTSVEVSCVATKIPDFLEVDAGSLNVGDSVHLSDLVLPEGVSIVELSHGEGHDQAVVTVVATRASHGAEDEEAEDAAAAE